MRRPPLRPARVPFGLHSTSRPEPNRQWLFDTKTSCRKAGSHIRDCWVWTIPALRRPRQHRRTAARPPIRMRPMPQQWFALKAAWSRTHHLPARRDRHNHFHNKGQKRYEFQTACPHFKDVHRFQGWRHTARNNARAQAAVGSHSDRFEDGGNGIVAVRDTASEPIRYVTTNRAETVIADFAASVVSTLRPRW